MKKFFIYTVLFFITITAQAQVTFHPQDGMVFFNNNNYSIDNYNPFNLSYPTASLLPNRPEGYAQLNDSACGNVPVIFSTDGINAYNGANGSIIPGTTGLLGESQSTNAATIVPISGSRALIITTKAWSNATNLSYSSILNYTGTCGSYTYSMPAITKNVPLPPSATGVTAIAEKVTVVKKASGNDYWLIMHEATNAGGGSNKYLVFSINYTSGVITASNDYSIGTFIRKIGGKGQMQAIYSQSALPTGPGYYIGAAFFIRATSILYGAADLLSMDASTGALTLKESATSSWARPYGLEFSRSSSPSQTYFFIAPRNGVSAMVFRFNASLPAGTVFGTSDASTYTGLPAFRRFGQLQCLDNDAIYAPIRASTTLLYIPNASSTASFPTTTATTWTGLTNFNWGLPNYWRN
jgi:hypothetical protein